MCFDLLLQNHTTTGNMFQEKLPLLRRSSSGSTPPLAAPNRDRRGVYLACLFIGLMILLRVGLLCGLYMPYRSPQEHFKGDKHLASAHRILSKHPLIDGHDDLLMVIRDFYAGKVNNDSFQRTWEHGDLVGHLDVPRLTSGQMGGAFWSAWVPCPANNTDFSVENYAPSMLNYLR